MKFEIIKEGGYDQYIIFLKEKRKEDLMRTYEDFYEINLGYSENINDYIKYFTPRDNFKKFIMENRPELWKKLLYKIQEQEKGLFLNIKKFEKDFLPFNLRDDNDESKREILKKYR